MDPFAGSSSDPQSLHKYVYVHGDPINGIDPTGEATLASTLGAASIGGALSGAVIGGIRGGVQGAVAGAVTGAILAPLVTLATIGGGIGIAGLTGISSTTGVYIAFSLVTGASLYSNGKAFVQAENSRERWASGLSVVLTLGTFGYGSYKFSQLPNLPNNAPNSNSVLANSRSNWGTWLSEFAAAVRAERVVAREVTVQTASGRVRVDMVTRNIFTGALRFVESKFGANAKFTGNQQRGYPELMRVGGEIRTDKLSGVGLPRGTRVGPSDIRIDLWNGANPGAL